MCVYMLMYTHLHICIYIHIYISIQILYTYCVYVCLCVQSERAKITEIETKTSMHKINNLSIEIVLFGFKNRFQGNIRKP